MRRGMEQTELLLVSAQLLPLSCRESEARRDCSVRYYQLATDSCWAARTQYESVAAIRGLRGGREGARRDIWPG